MQEKAPSETAIQAATLANRLSSWLAASGVQQSEVSVDLADIVGATKHAEQLIVQLMTRTPGAPEEASLVLDDLAALHAWLFGEMQHHLTELSQAWPLLEDHFARLAGE